MPAALAHTGALEELAEVADKYRRLESLRDGEPGRTDARRDAMRAIAIRFPGALREWDEAPVEELRRRRAAADHALALLRRDERAGHLHLDAPEQAWLRLSTRVHRALRRALAAKRLLAGRAITDELAALRSLGVDRARLEAIAAPPEGRLSELIHREVARAEGVSVEALKAALFPAGAAPACGPSPGPSRGDHTW